MYTHVSGRERDGAVRWTLFQDPADPQCHIETFMATSWGEYVRQQERITQADHMIEHHARS